MRRHAASMPPHCLRSGGFKTMAWSPQDSGMKLQPNVSTGFTGFDLRPITWFQPIEIKEIFFWHG
jgi:hypothetical protein